MAENIENPNDVSEDLEKGKDPKDTEPKSYTQDELNALLEKARKEGETNGYVKGKTDTTTKFEKKIAEQTRLAKEEAEKQAKFEKMSELEKAQTEANESKAKLQELEDKIALNEQKDETRKLMKDKGLPDTFLDDVLVFKDAEATLNKIIEVKELFDAEVQKAVEARISTHVPKQSGNDDVSLSENMARKALGLKQV